MRTTDAHLETVFTKRSHPGNQPFLLHFSCLNEKRKITVNGLKEYLIKKNICVTVTVGPPGFDYLGLPN